LTTKKGKRSKERGHPLSKIEKKQKEIRKDKSGLRREKDRIRPKKKQRRLEKDWAYGKKFRLTNVQNRNRSQKIADIGGDQKLGGPQQGHTGRCSGFLGGKWRNSGGKIKSPAAQGRDSNQHDLENSMEGARRTMQRPPY